MPPVHLNLNDFKNLYDGRQEDFLNEMIEYISNIKLIYKSNKNITQKCKILHKQKGKITQLVR